MGGRKFVQRVSSPSLIFMSPFSQGNNISKIVLVPPGQILNWTPETHVFLVTFLAKLIRLQEVGLFPKGTVSSLEGDSNPSTSHSKIKEEANKQHLVRKHIVNHELQSENGYQYNDTRVNRWHFQPSRNGNDPECFRHDSKGVVLSQMQNNETERIETL